MREAGRQEWNEKRDPTLFQLSCSSERKARKKNWLSLATKARFRDREREEGEKKASRGENRHHHPSSYSLSLRRKETYREWESVWREEGRFFLPFSHTESRRKADSICKWNDFNDRSHGFISFISFHFFWPTHRQTVKLVSLLILMLTTLLLHPLFFALIIKSPSLLSWTGNTNAPNASSLIFSFVFECKRTFSLISFPHTLSSFHPDFPLFSFLPHTHNRSSSLMHLLFVFILDENEITDRRENGIACLPLLALTHSCLTFQLWRTDLWMHAFTCTFSSSAAVRKEKKNRNKSRSDARWYKIGERKTHT